MFKWYPKGLLYITRETLYTMCIFRMIQCLVEHNVGFYELFFTKYALYHTIALLFFGSIVYTIDYHWCKNKKL